MDAPTNRLGIASMEFIHPRVGCISPTTIAGHGKINNKDELVSFADDAYFSLDHSDLISRSILSLLPSKGFRQDKIDAVTILNACHVGIATQSPGQTGKAAEVVSAVRAKRHAF